MRVSLLALVVVAASLGRGEQPKDKGRAPFSGHTESVTFLAFSPDGKTLASASHDKTIKLWDVPGGQEKATLGGHTAWVECVVFSPDGKTLASAGFDKTVKLWDVETAKEKSTLQAHPREVTAVAFSPDGKTLASCCQGADEPKGPVPGQVKLWEVATGQERGSMSGHPFDVWDVAFSPDGKTLASAGGKSEEKIGKMKSQGEIILWDVPPGKARATLKGHAKPVTAIAFTADGKTLVSASEDNTAKVWDVQAGKEKQTLRGHQGVVVAVAVSSDGKLVATGSRDKTVRLWDAATGKELAVLTGHSDQVRAVALTRDGKTLASGGDDKSIRLWDVDAALKKGK
jgi:WD40 repeat protein